MEVFSTNPEKNIGLLKSCGHLIQLISYDYMCGQDAAYGIQRLREDIRGSPHRSVRLRRRRRPQQHQQPTQHPPGAPATSLTASTSTNDPTKATAAATYNVKGGGLPAQGLIHAAQFAAQSSGNLLPGFSYVHTVVLVDSVSENGVFAFGFWEKDGDDVDEFVVGIRYNLGDKATHFTYMDG
ncbi:Uncharacterized protein Fot_34529 [Forsythia ovata]|uniref:Uncharacterized protein n=1 Tax=Forsythia ovata TaxID=205694 RepID=A0ABD1SJ27_9LAMI